MDAGCREGAKNGEMRSWVTRVPPFWVDATLAFLLSVLAVGLVPRGGPAPVVDAPLPPPGIDPTGFDPTGFSPAEDRPATLLVVLATLLVTVPLVFRRRWPVPVFVAQFLGLLAVGGENTWVTLVALLIGTYSLAVYGKSPVVSIGTVLAAGATVAVSFDDIELPIPGWAAPFAILLPFGLFGVMVRALRARAAASAERAEALRTGQEAATRAAVAEERARIARELHDVVSHHVSVMVIQAGAAGKVLDVRPDLARDALRAITDSGREAMGELRHLLGLLAPDSEDDELLHPLPGLDQLDALVAKVRAAGQPVTIQHTAVGLPRAVDAAAYRVVQEALTNALRYAPGAPTTVVIRPDGDVLTIEVTDQGTSPPRPSTVGYGSGLLGLAERLRLYQGTLDAGRRVGGGFRVSGRIPLAGRTPLATAAPSELAT
jgi:signal transduction histidine kinase